MAGETKFDKWWFTGFGMVNSISNHEINLPSCIEIWLLGTSSDSLLDELVPKTLIVNIRVDIHKTSYANS